MFFAKRSAESHSRPGKRSAAGEDTRRHTRLCAGWRYAYPAYGGSRKPLYPVPGKRSAAGR
ncbi:hypothetical protein H7U18_10975 [Klebsiella pneumoniae]|uniref:Uncharacterized protein n=1 Tax=Klebsiella pneumoniae TaxID=573 RepID=A0A923ERF3_KLEPN|nr:hypothetical protein [Klebsiella pneumoniae]